MKMIRRVATVAIVGGLLLGTMPSATARNIGQEGCTPGYWKNHTDNWEEYKAGTLVAAVFDLPAGSPYAELTLEEALALKGGPGVDGATRILLRAATAAVLNAAHEGLGYPYRRFNDPFNIVATVNTALASSDRAAMLDLAATLDDANNLGCPLN